MAEMEVSPQEEMANPQEGMKVFAVERPGRPEHFVSLSAHCVEYNRRHSYLLRIWRSFGVRYSVDTGGDTVLEVHVLLS